MTISHKERKILESIIDKFYDPTSDQGDVLLDLLKEVEKLLKKK